MIRSRLAREKAHNILSIYKITELPIDVVRIAGLLGFKVLPFDFPQTMSGVIKIEGTKKVIVVNKNHAEVRQRFTIAHELGHYLSGHSSFSHEETFVDPDKKYLDPHHRDEEEADEFAAELLMPESLLKIDVIQNKLSANDLATKYNVSEQAMWLQLINLKLAVHQSKAI